MSEIITPEENVQNPVQNTVEAPAAPAVEDLSDKSLAELSDLFVELKDSAQAMLRSKEAEAIKSAFYKLLLKLKAEAGEQLVNPFEAVEENFKALYADYKKARAEYNAVQFKQREENLAAKKAIIEELKALVDSGEDLSSQFQALRSIQDRWRNAGPVPATDFRDVNDTYQFYVEKFYDNVKINRDLRDLDFQKNLELKTGYCESAEKLSGSEDVVGAFHELQKLHEQWKELGPVAKEHREDIWNRFKAATAVINKKYQAHFEGLKEEQEKNLAAKAAICDELEQLLTAEPKSSAEWNDMTGKIEELQAKWRKIGFATRKENQKIYDRFRAGCDAFFARKKEFYSQFKDSMNENLEKKMAIIEQAEALKDSTDWKKTTDQFISLQKQWKEIGSVPRKKSEQLWTRFRAACDEFFARRDKEAGVNDFHANLRAKKQLVEDIKAFEPSDNETANAEAMRDFAAKWQGIGFVPFKEKEAINAAYREAMEAKFPLFGQRPESGRRASRGAKSERDLLIDKYHALQQDITTYENNIGFFSSSKNSAPLLKQMEERIAQAKAELKELEDKIRNTSEDQQ